MIPCCFLIVNPQICNNYRFLLQILTFANGGYATYGIKIEKLILYNQYEILKNLCPDEKEKEYYEDEQKTIMYGSDSDIEETASNFFGTSEEVKEEVYGILEMFRWLECSFKKNNPDQEIPYNNKNHLNKHKKRAYP